MAKSVIIAEKPNLARNIISGIKEKFQMKDGFAESSNYICLLYTSQQILL